MIQDTINPTPEDDILMRLSAGGKASGGGSKSSKVRDVYIAFGHTAASKRLKLMEVASLVKFAGRGRNRKVWLTVAGMKKADSL